MTPLQREEKHLGELLGKYVKFRVGRSSHFGRVSSIEDEICNIIGMEQGKYQKPAYHYPYSEVRICTHDEVFKLGRSLNALMK